MLNLHCTTYIMFCGICIVMSVWWIKWKTNKHKTNTIQHAPRKENLWWHVSWQWKQARGYSKWIIQLSKDIDWDTTFYTIQKIHQVKLKWFQVLLIHGILQQTQCLKKWKSQMMRDAPSEMHKLKKRFYNCFGDVTLCNSLANV